MNKLWIAATLGAALALAGCATPTDVLPIGPDTYSGYLEKLLPRSAAGTSEVNECDSKREQRGINRGKLQRTLRATAIFRGALQFLRAAPRGGNPVQAH